MLKIKCISYVNFLKNTNNYLFRKHFVFYCIETIIFIYYFFKTSVSDNFSGPI